MTAITGKEPKHWHDENGRHRMPDPRQSFGDKWKVATGDYTDADERAYVRHLIEHEPGAVAVRLPGDSDQITQMFNFIDNCEKQIAVLHKLITTIRERDAHK